MLTKKGLTILMKKSKQSDVSKLGVGDYVNIPKTEKSGGLKGFVKKIGRTNVVLDTFYQLGSTADDGIMQEITVKKADIKEFAKPKEAEKKPINTETDTKIRNADISNAFLHDK
jgi:hypothetical protein